MTVSSPAPTNRGLAVPVRRLLYSRPFPSSASSRSRSRRRPPPFLALSPCTPEPFSNTLHSVGSIQPVLICRMPDMQPQFICHMPDMQPVCSSASLRQCKPATHPLTQSGDSGRRGHLHNELAMHYAFLCGQATLSCDQTHPTYTLVSYASASHNVIRHVLTGC